MIKTAVSEYGFINAKLRARISSILTEEFRHSLLYAENIEGAVQVLAAQGYPFASEIWDKTGDIQNLEFELFRNHINSYRMVMKSTTGFLREFTNVLTMKPEIENIKSVLRLWYGSRIKKRPIGYRASYICREKIYQDINWNELINAVSYDDIKDVFQNTIYSSVFSNFSISDSDDRIFAIETALDRLYYRHLFNSCSKLKKSDKIIVEDILSTEIDLQNISWLIRYRHFYSMDSEALASILIPGGHGLLLDAEVLSSDRFSPVDILRKSYPELSALSINDKHNFSGQAQIFEQLLDETRKRKFSAILTGYPFTIGIILVFFFMIEGELNFISSVLNAKNYNLPGKRIEEIVE